MPKNWESRLDTKILEMKAELFKTDRNVKILIVSDNDKGDYKSIFCCNSELFKSDIKFVADFDCKVKPESDGEKAEDEIINLLQLLKPDVLLSEEGVELNPDAIKVMGRMCENDGIQIANNNGTLLLWYQGIDIDKLRFYCSLSFLINYSYETKNKLGVEK